MKSKLAIVVMVVIALLLGVALMKQKREAEEQKRKDANTISEKANEIIQIKSKLEEQKTVNATLETNLTVVTKEAGTLSNQLAQTSAELSRTSAELAKTSSDLQRTEAQAKAAAEKAQQEMAAVCGEPATSRRADRSSMRASRPFPPRQTIISRSRSAATAM